MNRLSPLLLCTSLLALATPADAAHRCFPQTIQCGETRQTSLDASECFIDEESWADFFTFAGPAGQSVTITMTSTVFTPSILLFDPHNLALQQDASGSTLTVNHALDETGLWRIAATSAEAKETGSYTITLQCSTPALPAGPFLTTPEIPGFRFKVRIGDRAGAKQDEDDCLDETLCISGAIPTRTEILIRVIGPRPNGFLWPTVVKLNTTQTEVWIQQISTGVTKYYLLPGAGPTSSDLPGFFDRNGFLP
ncbi:MAG TPA: PPC domain-containing protein [Thermoanaerobaculia bacterium]|nr:PPC domain-containing protein [Thermoanaerobaculia bacterium]